MLANFAQTYTYTTYTTTSSSDGALAGVVLFIWLIALILGIFMAVCLWRIFAKAGKPGWAAIVPVYNGWVLFEIVGYPGWWAILSLIPFVNIFPAIMMLVAYYKLGKLFGKSDLFSILLIFFPVILLPVLAFGSAQPNAGVAAGPVAPAVPTPTPTAPVTPVDPQTSQTPPAGPVSS